jgi:SAM-dependent methyltransferase
MRFPHKVLTAARLVGRAVAGDRRQRAWGRYQLMIAWRRIDVDWMPVEELGLDAERATPHGNSGGPDLALVLESLDITPRDSILDIGCGKGGAMITLAQAPFARVDGIDIHPDLAKIARRNLERLGRVRGTIRVADATKFQEFGRYTYLYMFHPFTEVVMREVVENIRQSRAHLRLIYKNPVYHDLLLEAGFRMVRRFDHSDSDFRVYEI